MKIYSGDIPFKFYEKIEHDGCVIREEEWNQLDWYDFRMKDVVLKKNVPFIARIQILSYSRGRSAANWEAALFEVEGCDQEYAEFLEGMKVTIFMTDMLDLILNNNLFNGKSNFLHLVFCKRGSNYGLKVYEV